MTTNLSLAASNDLSEAETLKKEIAIYTASLDHVAKRLPDIGEFIESSASQIVSEFRTLASTSTTQAENIERVLELTRYIKVGEESIPFERCIDILYQPLTDAISNILGVSKLAMSMVMAVSQAADNIKRVEGFISEIQDVTKQTNMLAMNTQIEAARAGEAGKSFQFIASEVKTLSQDIKKLSQAMQADIAEVSASVKESFSVIDKLANYDMVSNLGLKDRIDAVVQAIRDQNDQYSKLLDDAVQINRGNARNINNMIMNIQFQDRTSQVVGDMVNILRLVHNFVIGQLPTDVTQMTDGESDAILQKIIENVKLTDMRRQLVQTLYEAGVIGFDAETVQKYIVNEANATTSKALDASEGDIELF